jgi:protein gp37
MGDTKIEWTDATWNPVRGCSRVSDGCKHCYAEHQAMRITRFDRGRNVPVGEGAYDGLVTMTSQGPKWTGKIKLVEDKLSDPLVMKRPRRIFVNSMSDLFHEDVPFSYIDQVFAVMALRPQHTFQVLTKRALRMLQYFTEPRKFTDHDGGTREEVGLMARVLDAEHRGELVQSCEYLGLDPLQVGVQWTPTWPLPNVHLGVSVEDQATAVDRIPMLLWTPAAVRFISAEPLLGPLDLTAITFPNNLGGEECWNVLNAHGAVLGCTATIDGVIAGGESGPGARLMNREWAQSLRDQCVADDVPFFFKQWGGVDKKKAGRLLDGREWNELPGVRAC